MFVFFLCMELYDKPEKKTQSICNDDDNDYIIIIIGEKIRATREYFLSRYIKNIESRIFKYKRKRKKLFGVCN